MDIEIKGTYNCSRGLVLMTKNDKTQTREELIQFWKGKEVNGRKVIGVESQATLTVPQGATIGLLVECL